MILGKAKLCDVLPITGNFFFFTSTGYACRVLIYSECVYVNGAFLFPFNMTVAAASANDR